jgi:predicted nuclease with TOPRIM domain
MMRRINPEHIRAEHYSAPKRPDIPQPTDVTVFFQKRVIELETRLEEMKATVDVLREELKEKTHLINLLLENDRRLNETKEMNALLEELTLERTQKYVDLQSQLITHLENYDSYDSL